MSTNVQRTVAATGDPVIDLAGRFNGLFDDTIATKRTPATLDARRKKAHVALSMPNVQSRKVVPSTRSPVPGAALRTQAGLHLEPVTGARDPKVRSARVGGDYRTIIIAPEQGDTYLLVYVAHHDEAYRWGSGKPFETNPCV